MPLAQEGLRQMGDGSGRASREVGDRYLGSVAGQSGGVERLVAATIREAAGQSVKDVSAVQAQRVALQAVAAGVGDPASAVLAHVGLDVLNAVDRPKDAQAMAPVFFKALEGVGTSAQQALAHAVNVAGSNCLDRTTSTAVFKEGLQILQEAPLGRAEATLARFALAALSHASGGDGRAVGQIVFQEIKRTSMDAEMRGIAHAAFENSIPSRGMLFESSFGYHSTQAEQRNEFERIRARAAMLDEQTASENLRQLQKMALPERDPGTIEVRDESVVIGGVRVEKRSTARPTP